MKNQIKKLIAVILLTLGTIFVSLAQTHYKETVRTQGEDISIESLAINKRPYENEDVKKTRILAKNGTEFAITFPEKYQNLSIVRNDTNIVIEGRKIKVIGPGHLSFKFTYTENGVSYTCDILGDVNYYGELKCGDRAAPEIIEVIRSGQSIREGRAPTPYRETMKLEASERFAGVWWGFYVPNLDIKNPTLEQLQKFEETIFSDKKQITLGELLEVGRQKGKLRDGQIDIVVEFGDDSHNTLENEVPGGTSLQMVTLIDARTYKVNLSQDGQGTVSVSESQLKSGESATLTARAAQGWRFDHWEENGQNVTENPLTITMGTQDRSIKAVFTELPKVRVTLQIVDTNGQKLADPQYQDVTSGGTVTFQVPNLANVNFKGWKRNGQIVETGSSYTLSNVTQNETIQAVFEVPVQSLSLSFTELSLKVGESKPLPSVTVIPSNATDQTITWVSNDPGIAKIENGKVVGVSAGSVNLVASSSNQKKATLKVVVAELSRFVVTLQIVDTKGQKLAEPQQRQVTSGGSVTFQVPNLADASFKVWKRNGQIIETGSSYTLSNVTQNETIQAVFEIPVQSLSLSFTELSLKVGEAKDLPSVTVTPSNATDQTITWVSNDLGIAKIENGKVVGVSSGTIQIIASSTNSKTTALTVKVSLKDEPQPQQPQEPQNVPVQSITVTPASITAKVGEGSIQLTATVLPANATNKTVTWISKNEQVVKVDSSGKVTIIGAGDTAIEAKAGEKTFTVQVKIEAQSQPQQPQPQQPQPQQPQNPKVLVESLSLSFAELSLKVGEVKDLPSVTVTPPNATDQAITWISNKPEVAKVENGKVVGVSSGTVQIIANSTNSKTAMLNVTVTPENQVEEEDFPPYVKELPNFKVGQVVNLDDLVWERRDGIEIEEYLLLDTQGKLLPLGTEYQREANKLTFSAARVFVLVVKFKQNARNWQQVEFTIEVKP